MRLKMSDRNAVRNKEKTLERVKGSKCYISQRLVSGFDLPRTVRLTLNRARRNRTKENAVCLNGKGQNLPYGCAETNK